MSKALSGLKILDLTMNLPGPYLTWLLASMGADVVKVENPVGGDYARALGTGTSGGSSPFFDAVNRNKKSITLNLKHPEGRKIFLELLQTYDVLVEGFRPGTMDRLDLGFAATSQKQPRLIYVSISGYGQASPYRLRAGHDLNYLALAGIIGMTGTREGEPAIPGIQIADIAGGSLMGMTGLLAAVIQRERTGQGQFVDISMFDGALSMATMVFSGVELGMEAAEPGKMLLNGRFPCYGLYRTSDGRFMSLGALEPKFWANFCSALERPDLVSGQFGGPDVVEAVKTIFHSRTQAEWIDLMKAHDACCEPVINIAETVESELVQARSMIGRGPDGMRYLGSPVKMSASPPAETIVAPGLGEHTDEILSSLGLNDDRLRSLREQGVI
jgi:alpha-methylacyl-CoA racemase